jgi:uncharacterized protein with PIN domain
LKVTDSPESSGPKFLVDGMLGSLATKLRILGFDTNYDKKSKDSELISIARKQDRFLVTSDHELFLLAKQVRIRVILILGKTEEKRLLELLTKANIKELDESRVSRCSLCNSVLERTFRKDEYDREIFKCPNCSKLYWHGSHWIKLDSLFSKVNDSLKAITKREDSLSAKQIKAKQKEND